MLVQYVQIRGQGCLQYYKGQGPGAESLYNKVGHSAETFVAYSTHLGNKLPESTRAAADLETSKSLINN